MSSWRDNEFQDMRAALGNFIQRNQLQKGIDKVQVYDAWNAVMGPTIQKYTSEMYLKNKILYVTLSSAILRTELQYGIPKIIANLNQHLGKELIENVKLR